LPSSAWNQYVSYISGGLLYGKEVQRPADFVAVRRNRRTRQLNRSAPMRRKVLARLSNGWSAQQIALHLGISLLAVKIHTRLLCREENVPDVYALAKKLNFAKPPPRPEQLQRVERAKARRPMVQQMLLASYGYQEIAHKLGVSLPTIRCDVVSIYRAHGIKGRGPVADKRALARKLGLPYASKADQLRIRAIELREKGLLWKEVARELGIAEWMARYYGRKVKTQPAEEMRQGETVAKASL
jgi:DNA-binding NarL/FixJ family response regulator